MAYVENTIKTGPKMANVYIFFMEGGFYPLELASDEEAAANGRCNPGTLRIENALTGETIWQPSR